MKVPWFYKEIMEMPEVVGMTINNFDMTMIASTESERNVLIRYNTPKHELEKIKEKIREGKNSDEEKN